MERIKHNITLRISPPESVAEIARKAYLFSVPIRKIEDTSICMKARIEKDEIKKERGK